MIPLCFFDQFVFDINIKYMHAGMNHCLAAAAVSRRQESALKADVGRVLRQYIRGLQRRLGDK